MAETDVYLRTQIASEAQIELDFFIACRSKQECAELIPALESLLQRLRLAAGYETAGSRDESRQLWFWN